jgi:Putative transmembrane protein (PGPGW)
MFDMPGWDRFVHSRPGRRFQARYRRKRQARASVWKRCALVCGGIVLALVGIFFMAVPGPGIPILAIGLALVAQESAAMARLLDRTEIRLRRSWKRLRKRRSGTEP